MVKVFSEKRNRIVGEFWMNDWVFVVLIVGFFIVSGLYVHFCGNL